MVKGILIGYEGPLYLGYQKLYKFGIVADFILECYHITLSTPAIDGKGYIIIIGYEDPLYLAYQKLGIGFGIVANVILYIEIYLIDNRCILLRNKLTAGLQASQL